MEMQGPEFARAVSNGWENETGRISRLLPACNHQKRFAFEIHRFQRGLRRSRAFLGKSFSGGLRFRRLA
jgi:hypothetical protein